MDHSVVTEPCRECKYTDCVTVCPVDCFYQDDVMLYIDPDECVCCDACIPECPVEAIFRAADVPARWSEYIELNAEHSTALKESGANITEKQDAKLGPDCSSVGDG